MGRAVSTGQIMSMSPYKGYLMPDEEEISLPKYIKKKVKLMHEFGFRKITKEFFDGCMNEIQVDQRAHVMLVGR